MKNLLRYCAWMMLFILAHQNGIAHGMNHEFCSHLNSKLSMAGNFGANGLYSTGKSGTGANIDVKYHRFDWRINPDSTKYIKGSVTTYFKTITANVNQISFDLHNNLNVTAVKFRGSNLPSGNINHSSHKLTINLGTNLANDFLDSVTIFYQGVPPNQIGEAIGYIQQKINSSNVIWTLSESYEDRNWWPCKADMQDKIDSLDFIISVPSGFWVAANGKLVDSSLVGSNRIFKIKHRYPIASYLVAIGVGKYTKNYRGTVNINGTQVPIVYYYLTGRVSSEINARVSAMDKVKEEMVVFSNLFGDYPFKNELYGMYEFGFSGGMEHQTFSGMSWSAMNNWSVIAHELAHQWFGNKVSFATWNDLWLAEGFAKYLEVIAAQNVSGLGSASSHLSGIRNTARSYGAYAARIPDANMVTSDLIWNSGYGGSVYYRGAMVISMLRALLGDEKFFQACRNFLNDPALAYASATTNDLKNHMNAVAGYDLSGFFQDWVMDPGYASYNVYWGNNGKWINIQLNQASRVSAGSKAFMNSPVVLRISGSSKDTTVVIYHMNGYVAKAGDGIKTPKAGNRVSYMLSFVPTSVSFDPGYTTMNAGTVAKMATLPVNIHDFKANATPSGNWLRLWLDEVYDSDEVEIQRSEDGKNFSTLGKMQLAEEASGKKMYQYFDAGRNPGTVYYRAKIIEYGAETVYSSIERITAGEYASISLYPTLTNDVIHINFPADVLRESKVNIYIRSSGGELVYAEEKKFNHNSAAIIKIPVNRLASGNYFVEITGGSGLKAVRQFTRIY